MNVLNTRELTELKERETNKLLKAYKKDGSQEIKKNIVEGNLKLVLAVLRGCNIGEKDQEDAFQAGTVGLIQAVDGFDASKAMFSTYAYNSIRMHVRKYISENNAVKMSRRAKSNGYRIHRFEQEYMMENHKEPSWEDVEKGLGLTRTEVFFAKNSDCSAFYSLNFECSAGDGKTMSLEEVVGDDRSSMEHWETTEDIRSALKSLNAKELMIVTARYFGDKTQTYLSGKFGVSQANVSRWEKAALKKLREKIKTKA